MSKFRMSVDCANDAFRGSSRGEEIRRIIKHVRWHFAQLFTNNSASVSAAILDANGNTCGEWAYEARRERRKPKEVTSEVSFVASIVPAGPTPGPVLFEENFWAKTLPNIPAPGELMVAGMVAMWDATQPPPPGWYYLSYHDRGTRYRFIGQPWEKPISDRGAADHSAAEAKIEFKEHKIEFKEHKIEFKDELFEGPPATIALAEGTGEPISNTDYSQIEQRVTAATAETPPATICRMDITGRVYASMPLPGAEPAPTYRYRDGKNVGITDWPGGVDPRKSLPVAVELPPDPLDPIRKVYPAKKKRKDK